MNSLCLTYFAQRKLRGSPIPLYVVVVYPCLLPCSIALGECTIIKSSTDECLYSFQFRSIINSVAIRILVLTDSFGELHAVFFIWFFSPLICHKRHSFPCIFVGTKYSIVWLYHIPQFSQLYFWTFCLFQIFVYNKKCWDLCTHIFAHFSNLLKKVLRLKWLGQCLGIFEYYCQIVI